MTAEGAEMARCPWCSAPLADPDPASCPSCGAGLREATRDEIPGLTAVDPGVILRNRPLPARSRFLGWLAGDAPDVPLPGPAHAPIAMGVVVEDERTSLEPPSPEVRREMLRLELAALEAEAAALAIPEPLQDGDSVEEPPSDAAGTDFAASDGAAPDAAVPATAPAAPAAPAASAARPGKGGRASRD